MSEVTDGLAEVTAAASSMKLSALGMFKGRDFAVAAEICTQIQYHFCSGQAKKRPETAADG